MMFPFDQLGQAAHNALRGAEEASFALIRTAQDAAAWAGDLFSGNVGVQAMPVPTVVDHVMAGNSTSWTTKGTESGHVAAAHHEIAADLTAMLNNLEPTWTGRGAEGAKQRTKAFSDLIERAARTLGSNGSNVTDAAYGFELAKRSMEPMGARPDKSFFDVATPWDTDTEDDIAAYNAKAQKNLQIYNAYVEHLEGQGQSLSGDYGQLALAPSADSDDARPTDSRRATAARDERPVEPACDNGDTTPTDRQSFVDIDSGKTTGLRRDDPHVPAAPTSITVKPERTGATDLTMASGVQDGRALSGLPSTSQLQQAVGSPISDSERQKLVGFPYSPVSSAPNPALRGGVAEGGSNESRRSTGVGTRVVGAGGTAGRPGGRIGAGSAGIAPAANGRPAAEDEEHERKYVRDDDSVFSDIDDGLVDPHTGFVPVPPTIGT